MIRRTWLLVCGLCMLAGCGIEPAGSEPIDKSVSAALATAVSSNPSTPGVIYRYSFDEGSGLSIDNTGRYTGGDGTLQNNLVTGNGPTFSADVPPGTGSLFSLAFDGVDDSVRIPDQNDYTRSGARGDTALGALTIEAWIKPAVQSLDTGQHALWDDYGNPGVFLALSNGFVQISISTRQHPGLGITLYAGKSLLTSDQWHHIAGVYDGQRLRIFVDGRSACAQLSTSGAIQDESSIYPGIPIRIGTDNASAFLPYKGLIDELQLHDTGLTQDQLANGLFAGQDFDLDDDGVEDQCEGGGTSTGDPHLISFDGLMFDFHGRGDYLLATNNADVSVQVRQEEQPGQPALAYNSQAAMKLGTTRLGFNLRCNPILLVDGMTRYISPGAQEVFQSGRVHRLDQTRYQVVWNTGERATVTVWRDHLEVRVSPSPDSTRELSGLLGVPDGDYQNDLRSRGGWLLSMPPTFEQLNRDFAETWRVQPGESLFDTAAPDGSPEDGGWIGGAYQRSLTHRPRGAFDLPEVARLSAERICRAQGILSQAVLEACIVDVAVSHDPQMAEPFRNLTAPKAVLRFPATRAVGTAEPDVPPGPAASDTGAMGCHVSPTRAALGTVTAWTMALAVLLLARRRSTGGNQGSESESCSKLVPTRSVAPRRDV